MPFFFLREPPTTNEPTMASLSLLAFFSPTPGRASSAPWSVPAMLANDCSVESGQRREWSRVSDAKVGAGGNGRTPQLLARVTTSVLLTPLIEVRTLVRRER